MTVISKIIGLLTPRISLTKIAMGQGGGANENLSARKQDQNDDKREERDGNLNAKPQLNSGRQKASLRQEEGSGPNLALEQSEQGEESKESQRKLKANEVRSLYEKAMVEEERRRPKSKGKFSNSKGILFHKKQS